MPSIKFGDIDGKDVQSRNYEKDNSEAAVVLADYGESTIPYTCKFKLHFQRTKRVKILRKSGFQFDTLRINLYRAGSTSEKLVDLKGTSYNYENGKVTETKLGNSLGRLLPNKESRLC